MAKNMKLMLNYAKIKSIEKKQEIALKETAEALKTDVIQAQVMPFDTGTMQNEYTHTEISSNKKQAMLIIDGPYSRRLYYHPEYNFQTVNNPQAKGKWLEDWISGNKKDFCKKTFAKFLNKEMNKL